MTTNIPNSKPRHHRHHRRREPRIILLYVRAIVGEFRWTLVCLIAIVIVGAVLYWLTPEPEIGGQRPSFLLSIYGAWMAMLAQPIYSPAHAWYLLLLCAIYPIFGFVLIGEGIVRFAMLMLSRKRGEKEWMKVMASTYRDHVILCGLGHLGARVLEALVAAGVPVVVLDKNKDGSLLHIARQLDVPILIRNMREDQALRDAQITEARAIIIATNDDMANLEVALDSRRMNPKIRVIMRLFDQVVAKKISGVLSIDEVFSSAALAAPIIAAMALESRLLGSSVIAGVPYVMSEITVEPGSALVDQQVEELEKQYHIRVMSYTPSAGTAQRPLAGDVVHAGDSLVIHMPTSRLADIAFSARGQ